MVEDISMQVNCSACKSDSPLKFHPCKLKSGGFRAEISVAKVVGINADGISAEMASGRDRSEITVSLTRPVDAAGAISADWVNYAKSARRQAFGCIRLSVPVIEIMSQL